MKNSILYILLVLSFIINIFFTITSALDGESDVSDTKLSFSLSDIKGNPEEALLKVIHTTKKELNIAIYNFDNVQILAAILDAEKRGVSIRIITDAKKAENSDSRAIFQNLKEHNIPIKINKEQKMHMKLSISDKKTVVTGSFNYTKKSAEENQEILLAINDIKMAKSMNKVFMELWESDSLEELDL